MKLKLAAMAALVATTLSATGCSYEQSRKPSPTVAVEYATADEAEQFGDACFEHMKIYAPNRFGTSTFSLDQIGEATVSKDKHGRTGFVARVNVHVGNSTVKLYCGTDTEYGSVRFSAAGS